MYPYLKIIKELHVGDFPEGVFFNVLGQFKLIPEVFALVNDLAAKEISQFHNVVDVVTVLYVVRLIYHSHVVENVVFSCHKLQQDHSNRPNV